MHLISVFTKNFHLYYLGKALEPVWQHKWNGRHSFHLVLLDLGNQICCILPLSSLVLPVLSFPSSANRHYFFPIALSFFYRASRGPLALKSEKGTPNTSVCELKIGAEQIKVTPKTQGEDVKCEDILWHNTTLDIVCKFVPTPPYLNLKD